MPSLRLSTLCLTLVCLCACAGNNGAGPASSNELHALMSSRIEVLLSQIEVLVLEQQLDALALEREQQRRAGRIATAAASLQQAAESLLQLQATLGLAASEQDAFATLARQLALRGADLENLARASDFAALEPAMARTRATCDACHALYRNP